MYKINIFKEINITRFNNGEKLLMHLREEQLRPRLDYCISA